MKIRMSVSPRSPEASERKHWTVAVIRGFGILQVLGGSAAGFFSLAPILTGTVYSMGVSQDTAGTVGLVLAMVLGVLLGFVFAAMTFAIANFFDDVHAIRGYLRDVTITGQYYDE